MAQTGRIIKFAFQDFSRNMGISVATIFVLTVAILMISGLLFFHGAASYLISQIQDRIDITAYFKADTQEENILKAKTELAKNPNIKRVEYISQEKALDSFNDKHSDNDVFSKALKEVGGNPFLPSLNIVTNGDPEQYKTIADQIQKSNYGEMLEKVDFSEKKGTIEKVYAITSSINRFGIILGVILMILAIAVVFNTIKLAVENSKDEIATMRIVGAPDNFVRGPFIVQGIIYGCISFLICIFICGLAAFFLAGKIAVVLPGFDAFGYFASNFWWMALVQLAFGVGVGMISSSIVVKKHLKI